MFTCELFHWHNWHKMKWVIVDHIGEKETRSKIVKDYFQITAPDSLWLT